MVLGTDTVVLLVGGPVVVLAIIVLAVVIAPWRSLRDERPLEEEVETRLLLGEDPTEVAADVDAMTEPPVRGATVTEIEAGGSDRAT